ncbi:hypothetical protein PI95_010995 [Hassallia byssoidea VB512170]|uniref:Uncharacterized protein n=1 Tax=Hassallia byssoidea VB512170 TaxID=1304833 RepID=A0A846H6U0_9CYAN|nr:hypothetical protein [Hassalia byssoidea]NEU73072.1 hypothetical protein [Hassalia byssoidea VB512170]
MRKLTRVNRQIFSLFADIAKNYGKFPPHRVFIKHWSDVTSLIWLKQRAHRQRGFLP